MLNAAVIAAVIGWLAVFFLLMRLRDAQQAAPAQLSASNDAEEKLDGLRKELTAAKEATERKAKQVEELRAEAKKKARREGKKEKATDAPAEAAEPGDKELKAEVARLKKAIVGLEKQIEITTKDAAKTVADAEKIANESAAKTLEAEKAKAKEAVDARKKVEKTLEELRASIKKKAEARPDVPGSGLDLKGLPTEAVQELARYYRKAEHFEKLHSVAQGQLQLAQDRFNEQQKRYFAVCRELAVVAGKSPSSDVEARNIAESATQKTNAAVANAAPSPAPSASASASAESGDEGDGEKKKRRRRRRKKKSDGTEAAGADGSEQTDDASDGDTPDQGAKSESSVAASSAPAASAEDGGAKAEAAADAESDKPKESVVADATPAEKPQATASAEG